ncbi:hypothetical protein L873DRAFT_1891164 [Choiromyces venosus 120613-1]|uniref:Uncharacterized protein n=1 Tax=Choiromyces venosus 120613-1 TaxID=1336337 RepID=A0A3N4JSH5_9PEZI|nr:hypothetical protein L873DRAFT_1891164 [Choiromyces venosus 120613-1]
MGRAKIASPVGGMEDYQEPKARYKNQTKYSLAQLEQQQKGSASRPTSSGISVPARDNSEVSQLSCREVGRVPNGPIGQVPKGRLSYGSRSVSPFFDSGLLDLVLTNSIGGSYLTNEKTYHEALLDEPCQEQIERCNKVVLEGNKEENVRCGNSVAILKKANSSLRNSKCDNATGGRGDAFNPPSLQFSFFGQNMFYLRMKFSVQFTPRSPVEISRQKGMILELTNNYQ